MSLNVNLWMDTHFNALLQRFEGLCVAFILTSSLFLWSLKLSFCLISLLLVNKSTSLSVSRSFISSSSCSCSSSRDKFVSVYSLLLCLDSFFWFVYCASFYLFNGVISRRMYFAISLICFFISCTTSDICSFSNTFTCVIISVFISVAISFISSLKSLLNWNS